MRVPAACGGAWSRRERNTEQIKRRKRPRLATARALELLAEIAGHVYTASPEVSGQTPYRSADGAVPRGSGALTAQFGLLSAGGTVGVSESVNRLKMERVRAFAPPRDCPRRSGWKRRFRRPDDRAGLKNLRRERAEAAAHGAARPRVHGGRRKKILPDEKNAPFELYKE